MTNFGFKRVSKTYKKKKKIQNQEWRVQKKKSTNEIRLQNRWKKIFDLDSSIFYNSNFFNN